MNEAERSVEHITRANLAKRWGISQMTVYRREMTDNLRRSRVGRRIPIRYPMSEVLRLEAEEPVLAK